MDANEQIAQFLGYAAIIAVVAWIISFGIRSAHKQEKAEQDKINSGPGRFRIIGVSRKTSEDCAWRLKPRLQTMRKPRPICLE